MTGRLRRLALRVPFRTLGFARVLALVVLVVLAGAGRADAALHYMTQWRPGGTENVTGITIGKDGNVYLSRNDQGAVAYVEKEAPVGGAQAPGTLLGTFGAFGSGPGQLRQPTGLTTDAAGDFYVTDTSFQPSGTPLVDRFKQSDHSFTDSFGSGYGSAAGELKFPLDTLVTANGVYVADSANHRVQQFSSGGAPVRAWGKDVGGAGSDSCTTVCQSGTSDPGGDGHFGNPGGLASDAAGHVYVADGWDVEEFTSSGAWLRTFDYAFADPKGPLDARDVNVLADGRVLVTGRYHLHVFSATGQFVERIGGDGGGDGQFTHPGQFAVDSKGYVYVIDSQPGATPRIEVFKEDAGGGSDPGGGGTPLPPAEPPKVTRPKGNPSATAGSPNWRFGTGVSVTCNGTSPCDVNGNAVVSGAIGVAHARSTAAVPARARTRKVTVGRLKLRIAAGKKVTLAFKLDRGGQALLRKKKRLKVAVTLRITHAGSKTISIRETVKLKYKRTRR